MLLRKARTGRADKNVAIWAASASAASMFRIAATALVHRLTVVTRNVADFEPMRAEIINPWQAADESI